MSEKQEEKFLNLESISDPNAQVCIPKPAKGITIYKVNQISKGDYPCRQCQLSYGWTTKTFWIPSKFAIQGKLLLIDDDMTGRQEEWTVDEVYCPELPYSYINERSQDYKKTREASDI